VNILTVFLIVFGIIALVGLFIIFFDKGLKRRS